MPLYSYRCEACKHEFEQVLKIAEMHLPSSAPCPSCGVEGQVLKTITGAPSLGDPVRLGIRRPDNGFKEVMQKIHDANPKSNLRDKFG
jgi:putative FmdB family regulatory protein